MKHDDDRGGPMGGRGNPGPGGYKGKHFWSKQTKKCFILCWFFGLTKNNQLKRSFTKWHTDQIRWDMHVE